MEWVCSAERGVLLLRALLFLSPLLGPGRCSSVPLELATAVGSRGDSRSKPNWSKERLKVEAEWGREMRSCGGSEEDMMVVEDKCWASLLAFPRPHGTFFHSTMLLRRSLLLATRRPLYFFRPVHSGPQTDRVGHPPPLLFFS